MKNRFWGYIRYKNEARKELLFFDSSKTLLQVVNIQPQDNLHSVVSQLGPFVGDKQLMALGQNKVISQNCPWQALTNSKVVVINPTKNGEEMALAQLLLYDPSQQQQASKIQALLKDANLPYLHKIKLHEYFGKLKTPPSKTNLKTALQEAFDPVALWQRRRTLTLFNKYVASFQLQKQQNQRARQVQIKKRASGQLKLIGAFACVLANFWAVGYGTFVAYSWDVMQPIAYFVGSAATIFLTTRFKQKQISFAQLGTSQPPRRVNKAQTDEYRRQLYRQLCSAKLL